MNQRKRTIIYLSLYISIFLLIFISLSWCLSIFAQPADASYPEILIASLLISLNQAVAVSELIAGAIMRKENNPHQEAKYWNTKSKEQDCLVVYTVLVKTERQVKGLLNNLETLSRESSGSALFGILADLPDAQENVLCSESQFIDKIQSLVAAINNNCKGDFFLFYRDRIYSKSEGAWIGWERKRGKILNLVEEVITPGTGGFSRIVGACEKLASVRYIITLDEDNIMPEKTMSRLMNSIRQTGHNANSNFAFEENYSCGILQPAPIFNPDFKDHSLLTKLLYDGVRPAQANCGFRNFYQDVFRRGSYYGKGIIDAHKFIKTKSWIPEGSVLSHDLLEGALVGSEIVSDEYVLEAMPETFVSLRLRQHRWIRGDLQLLPWLFGSVRTATVRKKNPLALLDKFKIFQNAIRATLPLALFTYYTVILWCHIIEPSILFILVWLCLPVVIIALTSLFARDGDVLDWAWYIPLRRAILAALFFCTLPFDAYLNADAIIRSIWRVIISRKHLLEWKSFDETQSYQLNLMQFIKFMRASYIIVFILFLAWLMLGCPHELLLLCSLLLWLTGPFLAWFVSQRLT